MISKKAQATIFVIMAIVIVFGVVLFLLLSGDITLGGISGEFEPVYNQYISCIEGEMRAAVDLAGMQGGRVYLEGYIPGSDYAPFSNQLNFMGLPVPYWYYVSGNGMIKQQVPSEKDIENGISLYIEERIENCNFDNFIAQGFQIEIGEPEVDITIEDETVSAEVSSSFSVSREDETAKKGSHSVQISSKLGKFYSVAKGIYEKEISESFFEDYASDVLRLYAPVDGVDLSCSGKVWNTREVVGNLRDGIEANFGKLKFEGNYYDLRNSENKYFVINHNVDESIQIVQSSEWPSRVEIYGDGVEQEIMVATPLGNQEGLGAMGFCYSPYHFVYDLSFPVLVQIYNNEEVFQFPVVIVIDKNVPRNALQSEIAEEGDVDFCEYYQEDVEINVYDVNLNPVDVNLTYNCFNQECELGETSDGLFMGKSPSCVNGYLKAKASGYSEKRQLFSSVGDGSAEIIIDREYNVDILLEVGGKPLTDGNAIVTLKRNDGKVISAVVPGTDKVLLSDGGYDVSVYVYGNSSIVIPSGTKRQCTEVSSGGFLGFFGGVEEQCYDINTPETKIDSALAGGGKGSVYILESELQKGQIIIKVNSLPKPNTLEQLQYNFESFDSLPVEVGFG